MSRTQPESPANVRSTSAPDRIPCAGVFGLLNIIIGGLGAFYYFMTVAGEIATIMGGVGMVISAVGILSHIGLCISGIGMLKGAASSRTQSFTYGLGMALCAAMLCMMTGNPALAIVGGYGLVVAFACLIQPRRAKPPKQPETLQEFPSLGPVPGAIGGAFRGPERDRPEPTPLVGGAQVAKPGVERWTL